MSEMDYLETWQMKLLAQRFWDNVDVKPGECWLWTGKTNNCGYGYLGRGGLGLHPGRKGGGVLLAHRVSYLLANGIWPEPIARHLCHTPSCVHPGHLIAGNWMENWEDRRAQAAGRDLLAEAREMRQ